jgi:hypothetical protein
LDFRKTVLKEHGDNYTMNKFIILYASPNVTRIRAIQPWSIS